MVDHGWTGGALPTFVTHLECSLTGERYPADVLQGLSKAGRPLLVRYDLDGARRALPREKLASRPQSLWRYRELLPVRRAENVVSLGEVVTPLIALPRLAGRLGAGGEVLVKDEGRLPTGSFKARGLVLAVSMAKELGVRTMAMPTNGNAGAAMAAYCARAGIKAYVFCPDDTPAVNVREIAMQGAAVFLVDGLIDDCGRLVAEGEKEVGWFNCSTLREPYRIEGKKTMGIELAEQLGWELPDVIFYPTGGGTGIIGMWKAFAELEAIGWIGPKRPRMVVVQAEGCAPMVKAWAGRRGARAALGKRAHHGGGHPRAAGGRRFSDPAGGARERRVCRRGRRRGDRRSLGRGGKGGRAAALPRGGGDLCGLQDGAGRRPGRQRRPRGPVQLRHRPQIPDARSRRSAEARQRDRLAAARRDDIGRENGRLERRGGRLPRPACGERVGVRGDAPGEKGVTSPRPSRGPELWQCGQGALALLSEPETRAPHPVPLPASGAREACGLSIFVSRSPKKNGRDLSPGQV